MTSSVLTDFEFAPFDIIDGDRGKNYPKQNEFDSEGHCLFLSATNVTKSGFDFSDCQFISEQKDAALRKGKLRRGDVVLTTRGTIGNSAYYSDVIQYDHMRINSGMVIFRCDTENILPVYLYHYLRSPSFFGQVNSLRSGVAQPQLPIRDMKKIKLPLPSVQVQSQISSVLSAYDDLIENNRRRIQLLEQAARLLYKEWFVHLRFPGHEHTQIINGVPEGWEKKPLGELLMLQRGFDLPVSKRKEGRFPIYASTGINGYHAEAKVKGPGVVTGRSGSLGTVMYVSCDFWPLNTTLWVKEFKLVGPHYANHLLANMQLEQYNGGAAVPTLNRNDVHRVEVLSPPSMLLRIFEDQSHDIVKQIDALTSMNFKLAEARDLLLPKLMKGEVAV